MRALDSLGIARLLELRQPITIARRAERCCDQVSLPRLDLGAGRDRPRDFELAPPAAALLGFVHVDLHPDGVTVRVIDLALFLGGSPQQLTSFVSRGLSWHPQASVFSGAGVTDRGALFSYHANWESAGRWGIELRTSKRRLLLCPLEQLQEQKRDSVEITPVEIDDHLDRQFKPGFYLQTKAMLSGSSIELLPTIQEHAERNARVYLQIVSGSPDEYPQAATTRRVA